MCTFITHRNRFEGAFRFLLSFFLLLSFFFRLLTGVKASMMKHSRAPPHTTLNIYHETHWKRDCGAHKLNKHTKCFFHHFGLFIFVFLQIFRPNQLIVGGSIQCLQWKNETLPQNVLRANWNI